LPLMAMPLLLIRSRVLDRRNTIGCDRDTERGREEVNGESAVASSDEVEVQIYLGGRVACGDLVWRHWQHSQHVPHHQKCKLWLTTRLACQVRVYPLSDHANTCDDMPWTFY
jgi:hypothetical protein